MIPALVKRGALFLFAILAATGVAWGSAVLTWRRILPASLSLLPIAYSLGLRHALDADHIAAIDNVTRSLVQVGQTPLSVGFYFSLGHSTIVIIATFLIAIISSAISSGFDSYNNVASYIGTIISSVFLIFLATINAISALWIYRQMKALKTLGETHAEVNASNEKDLELTLNDNPLETTLMDSANQSSTQRELMLQDITHITDADSIIIVVDTIQIEQTNDDSSEDKPAAVENSAEEKSKNLGVQQDKEWQNILESGGFFTRLFGKRLFRLIDKPYKMYFVGLLFGLGFDTATEITLLAISTQTHASTASWAIMFLPILFTCGMCLLDTLDGMIMSGAYGWALVSPAQKLYYNLVVTVVSFFFALCIALVELLGLVQTDGAFWDFIRQVGDNFSFIGIAFVATMILGWIASALIYYHVGLK